MKDPFRKDSKWFYRNLENSTGEGCPVPLVGRVAHCHWWRGWIISGPLPLVGRVANCHWWEGWVIGIGRGCGGLQLKFNSKGV